MSEKSKIKIQSVSHLYEILPADQRIIVDVLRSFIGENLPTYCREKLSFNVPFFYGNKGICIIWPAAIPGGGIKEGILLGFWYGNRLRDKHQYLVHGTNKQVYYKIFKSPDDINEREILILLKEAVELDKLHASK